MLPRLTLLLVLTCVGLARVLADVPAPFALWRLDGLEQIGGHAVTVVGQPQRGTDGGIAFDGQDDGLFLDTNPLAGATAFTLEICFRPDVDGPAEQRFFHAEDAGGSRVLMETRMVPGGRWALDTFLRNPTDRLVLLDREKTHPAGRWTWVALTYENGVLRHFINGVPELEGNVTFGPMAPGRTSLGVRQNLVSWFKGSIREIRVHHTALAASALQRAD